MASTVPLRIGIFGAARIATKNVRAMSKATVPIEVVAIASRSLEKAERFVLDNHLPETTKLYDSYDDLLNDSQVDAVYVPLPSSLHLKWVTEAAKKGKHVLCEKPVAVTVRDAEEMVQACQKAGVQFMDGSMWLHNPRTAVVKDILSQSDFGQLKTVISTLTFFGNADFQAQNVRTRKDLDGLGCLGDLAWYCVGFILWAFDYELPEAVYAHPGARVNEEGVLLDCGGTLLWADGRKAQLYCGFNSARRAYVEVSSETELLRLEDFVNTFREDSCSVYTTYGDALGVQGVLHEKQVPLGRPQASFMWEAFANAVSDIAAGGAPDTKWAKISLLTQKVVCALYDSHAANYQEIRLK